MSRRFIQKIKKDKDPITLAVLSAGAGSRIKSHEPRSLIKIKGIPLLLHQIQALTSFFSKGEIIVAVGCHANKIIKRIPRDIRVIENQLHETTGAVESLRLVVNNSVANRMFITHGDIFFTAHDLEGSDFSKSFIIVDTQNRMSEREVGVVSTDDIVNTFSYGLKTKWCQVVYLAEKEFLILQQLFLKNGESYEKMLTFEVLNLIINKGGSFVCREPDGMKLFEIDSMRDLKNENIDI